MNAESGRIIVGEGSNILRSGGLKHLCGTDSHIFAKGQFVLSPRRMDFERRNSPRVELVLIQLHGILVVRQTLSISIESEMPGTRLRHGLFESSSEAGLCDSSHPVGLPSASLETVSTNKARMFLLDVAETRHVNTVWSPSTDGSTFTTGDDAAGATPLNMVHHVVA